jgi:DNA repair protein RadC
MDWPAGERPREKLLERGAAALSDAELLAIFLRTGVVGKSAVDLARELLQRFGSLTRMFAATEAEFCALHGMGHAISAALKYYNKQCCTTIRNFQEKNNPLNNLG